MGRAAREPDDTVIEFLPADQHAFGSGGGDGTVFAGFDEGDDPFDEGPRSRWLVGVSAAVVAALVAVGVVAASPWNDTTAAPATTVPVTTVTAPASTADSTMAGEPAAPEPTSTAPGIVFDPVPDGFALSDSRVGFDANAPAYGWSEVWASPDATRLSGRWFALTIVPFTGMDETGTVTSVDVGGRQGTLVTDPAGVSTLRFDAGQTDGTRPVSVSAFGFTDTELIELGASIGVGDDSSQLIEQPPTFLRPELLDGLVRIAAAPAEMNLVDEVLQPLDRTAVTIYSSDVSDSGDGGDTGDTGGEELVLLQAAPVPTGPAALTALALDELILVAPPAELEGDGLVVGRRTVRNTLVSVAWWDVDGQRIIVLSTLDPWALVPLLPSVRVVGTDPPWILEPGFRGYVAVAASDPEPFRAEAQPAGTFELWATPGASRAQGTWVAVQQLPWVVGGSAPGRRIAVGDGTGVLDDSDTVTVLTWSPDDSSTITVTAHGLTVDQLVAVAELSARGDAQLLGETLFDGMSSVLERPTVNDRLDEELFTRSRSTSTFTRPDNRSTVVVESAPIDPPATTDEWDALVAGPPNSVNGPLTVDPRSQQVAVGVTQAGTSWKVNVDVGRGTVSLDDNGAEDRFMIDDLLSDRAVTLRSTPSTTFVVVHAAPELGAIVARVTVGGSARVIALRAVDGDDHLYGALAFSEDGDVTVELLDDEGRVVDGAA
jgi:hypothetical protein